MTTALYLAHLNPVTNAHVEIISELQQDADNVKVMPVIFKNGDNEVNTKSFPFSFEMRKLMLHSIFNNDIKVTDDYVFYVPFKKYIQPFISQNSWRLRKQILNGVEDDFFTYTGDEVEKYILKMYRLKPKIGKRKSLSATSVRVNMYDAALGRESDWNNDVPGNVAKIIIDEWKTVEKFAVIPDATTRVAGMKFPRDGWSR